MIVVKNKFEKLTGKLCFLFLIFVFEMLDSFWFLCKNLIQCMQHTQLWKSVEEDLQDCYHVYAPPLTCCLSVSLLCLSSL